MRDQIRSGNYKPGDWLPPERRLALDLGVDRRVIRTAINQLVETGLIIRRPHCRPIVGGANSPEAITHGALSLGQHEQTDNAASGKARSTPRSNFIALLMWHGGGQLERSFTSQQRIFWGMNQALAQAGYFAVFVDLGADLGVVGSEMDSAQREAQQLRDTVERGVSGIVFYPYAYRSNRDLIEQISRKIPMVTIDRRTDGVDTDFVGVDNQKAMYDTIMHLVHQGHRRIAYVTKNEPICPVQDRIQGYIDAMLDAGLEELVLSIPSRDQSTNWTSIDTIFSLPREKRPTAAAAFNDYAALYLTARLADMGLSVPGDVAVTGFDDIITTLPNGVGLTTVAQPYEDIGRKAVEVLLRRIETPSAPTMRISLPAELAIRESCAFRGAQL